MTNLEQPKFRTFVFEDDPVIRGLLEKLLHRREHEVFAFSSPAESPHHECPKCICPSGEVCADFIITDIQMPHATGLEFIMHQKERGCHCQNYAIVSGRWTDERMSLARELGCFILTKPFDISLALKWFEDSEMKIDPERKLNNWFQEKLEKKL